MNWNIVKNEFEPDGSLREIIINNTNIEDWKNVISYIYQTKEYNTKITITNLLNNSVKTLINNEIKNFIPEIELIYFDNNKFSVILEIFVSNIQINTHFVSVEEINFDLDPRQIINQDKFNIILKLMRDISELIFKISILVYEGLYDNSIFMYEPIKKEFIIN